MIKRIALALLLLSTPAWAQPQSPSPECRLLQRDPGLPALCEQLVASHEAGSLTEVDHEMAARLGEYRTTIVELHMRTFRPVNPTSRYMIARRAGLHRTVLAARICAGENSCITRAVVMPRGRTLLDCLDEEQPMARRIAQTGARLVRFGCVTTGLVP